MSPVLVGALLTLTDVPASSGDVFPQGAVVEEVKKGYPGDMAGLRPGDILLTWSRSPTGASALEGEIRSAYDLHTFGIEQLPLGPVMLRGLRDGKDFAVLAPRESSELQVTTRPMLPPSLLQSYERGRALVAAGRVEEGMTLWGEVAAAAHQMRGGIAAGCGLLGRIASEWAMSGHIEASRATFRDALECAQPLGPRFLAGLSASQGLAEWRAGELQVAENAYKAALTVRKEAAPEPLALAFYLRRMGHLNHLQGRTERAVDLFRKALAYEDAAGSVGAVDTLLLLAWPLGDTGEFEAAEDAYSRAARIAEGLAPEGRLLPRALVAWGGMASRRGNLATAEQMFRRARELFRERNVEESLTAWVEMQVAEVAARRGDLDAAEACYQRLRPLIERTDKGGGFHGTLLLSWGKVASARGDLDRAEGLLRGALAIWEKRAPGTTLAAQSLIFLGHTLARRGDRAAARALFQRARTLAEAARFLGATMADIVMNLGHLARAERDWQTAETLYQRALSIRERLNPSGAPLAQVLHSLGTLRRDRGELGDALAFFGRAVEVLEAQRGRTGGSDEAQSHFASSVAAIYHDHIELLVGFGRVAEAFHVLEKSRARSLLAMMAERDLLFDQELPAELERVRRSVDDEYERTKGTLGLLDPHNLPKVEQLTLQLRALRDRQVEIADRIRQSSPRLAALRYPEPLDVEGVQRTIDAGAVFLAYSVGKDKTILFVLNAAATETVEAITIPLGEDRLRERVDHFRGLVERTAPAREFYAEAEALYDLLLKPAEPRILPARRILLSLDGPLHRLPFAALTRNGRYVAEWKPVSIVPSGTVHAQLVRSRSGVRPSELVAFGDPRYADERFERLEATRREVETIGRFFAKASVYTGEAASEDRAKTIGKDVRYVHFACHGLIDDRFPLDSALALSTPPAKKDETQDNGLLHAWEIFERVRLDADLVTLSACQSAHGATRAGEGLLGLTRAFQYAGARSVLASLWSIGDQSTVEFMERFYRLLKDEHPRDEALRRAQLASIRAGHHPARWAAFQLYGAGGEGPMTREPSGLTKHAKGVSKKQPGRPLVSSQDVSLDH